jgi:hypothetical protein
MQRYFDEPATEPASAAAAHPADAYMQRYFQDEPAPAATPAAAFGECNKHAHSLGLVFGHGFGIAANNPSNGAMKRTIAKG